MKRALTGLRTAIAALTLVPMGEFEPDAPAAVPWYPWVGMAFGVLAISVASPASLRVDGPLGSLLVGVVIVAAWAGLSGLMHWDGLADTADGLLGGSTPERRLEIM
ncbi:MAG: adenosylcobinamide-GDP ribazoletransferase, partial [Actinobacteria bacterium]